MKQISSLMLSILMLTLLPSPTKANGLVYSMHYLGVLPGTRGSCATSINSSGQVIGWSATADDMQGAFLWNKRDGMTDIRVPGSLDYSGAINELGEIVGSYGATSGAGGGPAVREPNGAVRRIGNTAPYPYWSGGYAINNSGEIVGYSGLYAAIWRDDKIVWTADSLLSQANDINNNGEIVWTFQMKDGTYRAFSKASDGESLPLSLLNGTNTEWANSINDSGISVGYSGDHAVLWHADGSVLDLGGVALVHFPEKVLKS